MSVQKDFVSPAVLPAKVLVAPGQVVHMMDKSVSFVREEADLVVGSDLGTVIYENFFAQGENNALPLIEFADGTRTAGEEFLQAASPEMCLTPAPRPDPSERGPQAGPKADACCARFSVSESNNYTYCFQMLDACGKLPSIAPGNADIELVGDESGYFSLFGVDSENTVIFTLAPAGIRALEAEENISGRFEVRAGNLSYVVWISAENFLYGRKEEKTTAGE